MPNAATLIAAPTQTGAFEYSWHIAARDGFQVLVRWDKVDEGHGAAGMVSDASSQAKQPFQVSLNGPQKTELKLVHPLSADFIDVTLWLGIKGREVTLNANVPVSQNEFFNGMIGNWPLVAPPVPDLPDDESAIEAPGQASDLFPFVWMHPPTPRELADVLLRFVNCEALIAAKQLPLYTELAACTGSGAPTQKRTDATTYSSTGGFVTDISTLGATVAQFPSARIAFLAEAGEKSLVDQVTEAENILGISSIADFLSGTEWLNAQVNVWQSLFCWALIGQSLQSTGIASAQTLIAQLTSILRVGHYLSLLNDQCEALTAEDPRRASLCATAVLPDPVAAQPPSPTLSGSSGSTPPDTWTVLGPGKLKKARQRVIGYVPGELADVVNVMPRERQEHLERTVTRTRAFDSDEDERTNGNDLVRTSDCSNELADTIQEVMAANGSVIDLANVTPTYSNLNTMLSGTGSGSAGNAGWTSADAARMAQRLTEQAAKRLGERVSRLRGREWEELRERRQTQLFDNANHDRLVGVYRWVDRLLRVHVEELGSRLILAFGLNTPASTWLTDIAAQGTFPLQKPVALTSLAAAPSDLSAANYQSIGAAYGVLDLPPPPPATLSVTASISRVTLGDLSLLQVPPGYSVTKCLVTVATSDQGYNLACSIGGSDWNGTANPTTVPPLTVVIPQCQTTSVANAVISPPNQPVAQITTLPPFTALVGMTGSIPVTVMTAAPVFAVTVELSCGLVDGAGGSLMTAWQLQTYARLQQAWRSANDKYEAELMARAEMASEGQKTEVQRDALRTGCLSLLNAIASPSDPDPLALVSLFSWADMSWQYLVPSSNSLTNALVMSASEITRPASDRLFRRFLMAPAARVLLPVGVGSEAALLFYLQFQERWAGTHDTIPVTASTVVLIEELRHQLNEAGEQQDSLPAPETWPVRIPTPMIYLQEGSELPRIPAADPL